ncbi:two-component sensor histidine kinase [Paenibacillus sp. J23TS9]|uniref:cache domain-containing sensor histidine kinase n=1 Tax=Paenibacillus sp. J23TS9 TaxID=2807193 RepID=UPI001B2578F6|nr:sensor histidine kinase [Paenibacillus sp. J23TS9]GIP29183.1 two-component sensor histidine kinase [Paenibacillus sp. J23TS9]
MLKKSYQKYIKNKLFNKMILIYTIITTTTFLTLAFVIFYFISQSFQEKELAAQQKTVHSVSEYLNLKMTNAEQAVLQIYQDNALSDDFLAFMKNDYETYIKHHLDVYTESGYFASRNVDSFIRGQLEKDTDLSSIMLYSKEKKFVYRYEQNDNQEYQQLREGEGIPKEMIPLLGKDLSGDINLKFNTVIASPETGTYSIAYRINDPATLKDVGYILLVYPTQNIFKAIDNMNQNFTGHLMVMLPNGEIMFDTAAKPTTKPYPYYDQVISVKGQERLMLDEDSFVTRQDNSKSKLEVVQVVHVSDVEKSYGNLKRLIIGLTGLSIVVTFLLSYLAVKNVSRRTQNIIHGMRIVRNGNLSVRLPVVREDELGDISASFNQMCEDLNRHIHQVYISEIKQKHAELVAFQAQINPHFLYNTLEVIRMRAIAKGADDVAEMTYILSSLFKYLVKKETMVKISEEIENSRNYLEMFRIRYKERFHFTIDVEPGVQQASILKLSVQPAIENYILHGIRSGRTDNWIGIHAYAGEQGILIEIEDNGKGISGEKLAEIQSKLKEPGEFSSDSLGLKNVAERLRLMYGDPYGLKIDSTPDQGTRVSICIPFSTEEEQHV